jgi:LCP family protein required for cell wall assembly
MKNNTDNGAKAKKKKMSKKKKAIIIGSTIIGIVLVVVLAGFVYVNSLLGKINYVTPDKAGAVPSVSTDNNGDKLMFDKDVFNVLLIGSDTRDTSTDGSRSDSMILISINKETKKTVMTSFMRDMYVPIPGHGNNRLNAAFSFGGVNLLLETIQKDFDIKIDQYATVDFYSFINIIDKLGGVNITVSNAEVPVLNQYIAEINGLEKLPANSGALKAGGKNLLLTGKQALGYSRIRYVGDGDFERTERQRTVLTQVLTKLKGQNVFKLNSILNTLMPDITTNLTQGDITSLMLNAVTYMNYPVIQDRIPIDGSYQNATINAMDVLTVDLNKNIAELKSKIYNQN